MIMDCFVSSRGVLTIYSTAFSYFADIGLVVSRRRVMSRHDLRIPMNATSPICVATAMATLRTAWTSASITVRDFNACLIRVIFIYHKCTTHLSLLSEQPT